MQKNPSSFIRTLTPPRGIAALGVLALHITSTEAAISYPPFVKNLYLCVDFFFILSGFILMHAYSGQFRHSVKKNAYKKFMIARFARIYPLHLTGIALIMGMEILRIAFIRAGYMSTSGREAFTNMYDLKYLPLQLTFMQDWTYSSALSWNGPSWSIACEWLVYMIFPFTVAFIHTSKDWMRLAAMVLIIGGYYALCMYHPEHSLDIVYGYSLLRTALGFFLGTILYCYYRDARFSILHSDTVLAGIMAFSFWSLWHGYDVLTVCLLALIVFGLSANKGICHRICETQPALFLGNISFAIYMVHWPVILLVAQLGRLFFHVEPKDFSPYQAYIFIVAAFSITLILAGLAYHLIEMPTRNYLRKRFA
ncbi:MAG: acyltransferase [Proteobacteria bacterium]|nr:acyltransferase [Pseudomonadota bacterium]